MPSTITRSERAAMAETARHLRLVGQRQQHTVAEIVAAIAAAVPSLRPLETHRLAYGWSRREVVAAVAELYRAEGLAAPGLTESMLCHWEHGSRTPAPEYREALCRLYTATPSDLGVATAVAPPPPGAHTSSSGARCYARSTTPTRGHAGGTMARSEPESSLTAVRESLALTLASSSPRAEDVHEQLAGVVDHYDRTYSQHPPAVLAGEITATRALVAELLDQQHDQGRTHVLASCGWLSALLGNLAYHQGDDGAATAHLATALSLGTDAGNRRLQAWTRGAQAMIARTQHRWRRASDLARDGYDLAATPLQQAQLLTWAQLPDLAHLGQHREAERTLRRAEAHLEHAAFRDGRFGFDRAEFHLHAAESAAALGDAVRAREHADLSAAEKSLYGPGWVAARLARAQVQPDETAEISLDILTQVSPTRLRSTSRRRLHTAHQLLTHTGHPQAGEIGDQLRALPPA